MFELFTLIKVVVKAPAEVRSHRERVLIHSLLSWVFIVWFDFEDHVIMFFYLFLRSHLLLLLHLVLSILYPLPLYLLLLLTFLLFLHFPLLALYLFIL